MHCCTLPPSPKYNKCINQPLTSLTQKLLGRLCEQNRILKDHEAVVHRLRMDKVNNLAHNIILSGYNTFYFKFNIFTSAISSEKTVTSHF